MIHAIETENEITKFNGARVSEEVVITFQNGEKPFSA